MIKNWLLWFWKNLTRVGNNADFVNAGDDVRYDPFGISSAIQRALSFKALWLLRILFSVSGHPADLFRMGNFRNFR